MLSKFFKNLKNCANRCALNHADSPNLTNPSYKNYIALAFVLTAIYGAIYAIMRVCMVRDNISGANLFSADFAPMFIMGARLDLRAICVFVALVVILGYVANAIWRVNIANRTIRSTIGGGGNPLVKIASIKITLATNIK